MRPSLWIAATPAFTTTLRAALSGSGGWEIVEIPETALILEAGSAPEALLVEEVAFHEVGRSLIERLRAQKLTGRTPILVFTKEKTSAEPFLAAGAAAVLGAPFDPPTLTGRVRRAIDEARIDFHLGRLEKIGGADFVGEMVELFLTLTPGRLTTIRTALEAGDVAGVRFGAHQLKSSAANIGALLVYDLADRAETLATDGAAAALPAVVTGMEEAYERIRDILTARANLGGGS
jgi:HPt (histidine-containing phosphotransfer) domain-containing protein/CheY-like chemotaxis protein